MLAITAIGKDVRLLGAELKRKVGEATPVALLAFFSKEDAYDRYASQLRPLFPDIPILGASSGPIQFADRILSDSEVALGIIASEDDVVAESFLIENIQSSTDANLQSTLGALADKSARLAQDGYDHYSLILLEDAFTVDGDTLVQLVHRNAGMHAVMAGGLAGDGLRFQSSALIYNDQVPSNALAGIALYSKKQIGVGVRHGWESVSDYLRVTRSEGNVVIELDNRPALDVLGEELAKVGVAMDPKNPVPTIVKYGLGLFSVGAEMRVRAALNVSPDGSLVFAGQVPQGRNVKLMKMSPGSLVEGAVDSVKSALGQIDGPPGGGLIFSCGGRVMAFEDNYGMELEAICGALGAPLWGLATYGEIGRPPGDMIGFHNATLVSMVFPRA